MDSGGETDMIRAVIADDEEPARQELKHLLRDFGDVEVVAEAAHGPDALEAIIEHAPDVVFLDIHMPGLSGIEVARQMGDLEKPPLVVFITAYDQYAVEAFEAEAIDYLLKPIETERLAAAVDRARRFMPAPDTGIIKRIEEIFTRLGRGKGTPRKLSLKRGAKTQLVTPSELLYMVVEEGVVRAIGQNASGMLPYRSLDEAERDLTDANFFRASRTTLVNLDCIKEILRGKEGSWELVLENRDTVPLSRAQARKLRKLIKW